MMWKSVRVASKVAAVAAAGTASAVAHHSSAMFDIDKSVTLTGTVKEFQWSNPHTWVQLIVTDASGKATEWSIETVSPANLTSKGWTRNAVKAGDTATAVIRPLKTGGIGGLLVTLTVNGKVVGNAPL